MMDSAAALIERFYAALDVGDGPTIVAFLAEDAIVSYPAAGALPYGGSWHGRDGIGRFLDLHEEAEEILEFEPASISVDGGHVLVRGRFRGRSRTTGRTWETRWVHGTARRVSPAGEPVQRWQGVTLDVTDRMTEPGAAPSLAREGRDATPSAGPPSHPAAGGSPAGR